LYFIFNFTEKLIIIPPVRMTVASVQEGMMHFGISAIGRRISRTLYFVFTEEVQPVSAGGRIAAKPTRKPARPSFLDRDDPTDESWDEVDWGEVSRLAVGYLVLRGLPRSTAERMATRVAEDQSLQSEVRRLAGGGADEMSLASALAAAA
jgi:hypothetical protein